MNLDAAIARSTERLRKWARLDAPEPVFRLELINRIKLEALRTKPPAPALTAMRLAA